MTDSMEVQKAFGFLHLPEYYAIKALVALIPKGGTAVNIGAGAGTSGLILREAENIAKSWTIDIQGPGSPFGSLEGERNAFRNAGIEWNPARHDQVCGDSKDVGKAWPHGQVDFVFIDGDHSYEGAAGDIKAWLPNVKPGGIIALHDYSSPSWPDVKRATDELLGHLPVIVAVDTVIAFRVNA